MHNRLLLAILCLFLVTHGVESAAAETKTPAIPTPLAHGDKAYKQDGPEAFLAALLDNAVPDIAASKASQFQQAQAVSKLLRQVESLYGAYKVVELIDSISIADCTRVVYCVLNYERGPVFGVSSVYRTGEGEITTGFAMNTELHKVVPPNLIINRAPARQNGQ